MNERSSFKMPTIELIVGIHGLHCVCFFHLFMHMCMFGCVLWLIPKSPSCPFWVIGSSLVGASSWISPCGAEDRFLELPWSRRPQKHTCWHNAMRLMCAMEINTWWPHETVSLFHKRLTVMALSGIPWPAHLVPVLSLPLSLVHSLFLSSPSIHKPLLLLPSLPSLWSSFCFDAKQDVRVLVSFCGCWRL